MKKILFSIILLSLAFPMAAQYTMKLDSVIGADDFDRTRWKDVYAYGEQSKTETHYLWEGFSWIPSLNTAWTYCDTLDSATINQWNGESWEEYQRFSRSFRIVDGNKLLTETTTEQLVDDAWVGASHSTFEYDSAFHQVLNINYNGVDPDGNWVGSTKIVSTYNQSGLLNDRLYQTYRNGSWRDSQKDEYGYNAEGICIKMTISVKGGWGPGANQWREAERYQFSYTDDGKLESELLYSAGWFSSEMTLESKTDYDYDANGNEVRKTVSVFNEADWIVRDVFENTIDATVEADKVLGLADKWEYAQGLGLGSSAGTMLPLHNLWTHCVIASQYLDTEFALYCSGFQAVAEHQEQPFKTFASQGCLTVESQDPIDITVYDLTGRVVASKSKTTTCSFDLTPGLYLVRGGNGVVKAMVQ